MLCEPPPPWVCIRGVAHRPYVWPKQVGVEHWCSIPVRFLSGDTWQRETVAAIVTGPGGWNRVCGAQFVISNRVDAPVRVTFEPGSSWSQPGSYGVHGPFEMPTLNLGWIRPDMSERELRRVTLHEFGHALALVHEHQHPGVCIPWNRETIYAHYRRTNGWPPEMVDAQVLAVIDAEIAVATQYDPLSIMSYPIEPEVVTDPAWAHERAYVLSAGDVAMVQALYGPAPAQPGAFLPIAKG